MFSKTSTTSVRSLVILGLLFATTMAFSPLKQNLKRVLESEEAAKKMEFGSDDYFVNRKGYEYLYKENT